MAEEHGGGKSAQPRAARQQRERKEELETGTQPFGPCPYQSTSKQQVHYGAPMTQSHEIFQTYELFEGYFRSKLYERGSLCFDFCTTFGKLLYILHEERGLCDARVSGCLSNYKRMG